MKNKVSFFKTAHNYLFCLRFPFWKAYNRVDGEFCGYEFTEYDFIPKGWQKAFGIKLSKEIKKAGKAYLRTHKEATWEDILSWQEIKEKYGELRLYASAIDSIDKILTKYEALSIAYCQECGRPARHVALGWVEYLCDRCAEKSRSFTKRLTEKDIPEMSQMNNDVWETVDFKKEYGIDFYELWGLDKKR